MNINNITQRPNFEKITFYFLQIMVFGLPWSGALFRIGFFGFLLFYIISGQWTKKISILLDSRIVWISIFLFLTSLISLTYTIAPQGLALLDVERYLKLLLLGPLIFAIDSKEKRLRILAALAGGIAVLMLPTLLDGTGIAGALDLPIHQFANQVYVVDRGNGVTNLVYWRNQIVHGFFVSILFFTCLCVISELKKNRILLSILATICLIDVTFFIAGRMALLSLISALLFFAFLKIRSLAGRLLGASCLAALFLLTYSLVDTVNHRINTIFSETQSYYSENNKSTSAGHRLHYWKISLDLFDHAKIAGAGAGAFRHTLIATKDPFAPENHSHAHNEYLTVLSQYGLIGFSFFTGMLVYAFYLAGRLKNSFERYSYQGIVLIFSISTLTDSMLYNPHEGWTLVIVLSLIAAAFRSQHHEKSDSERPCDQIASNP